MKIILIIDKSNIGVRLDMLVSQKADVTRSSAQRLIDTGMVSVNNATENKSYRLRLNDNVSIIIPESTPEPYAMPENIPLNIVYEDNDVIVIDKPTGMVVHPAPGNKSGTLVNALLYHCDTSLSGIGGVLRPGIVHRIDKDTSGLLVVAKNDRAHLGLAKQLKTHTVSRIYNAILIGNPKKDYDTINLPIGRHPIDRKKMAVILPSTLTRLSSLSLSNECIGHIGNVRNTGQVKPTDSLRHNSTARDAITHYTVIERYTGFSYAKMKLETGRTHQIRVHMSYIGHPILGDTTYGGGSTLFEKQNISLLCGQCLHASQLDFIHPLTNQAMTFHSELPTNMQKLLDKLQNQN